MYTLLFSILPKLIIILSIFFSSPAYLAQDPSHLFDSALRPMASSERRQRLTRSLASYEPLLKRALSKTRHTVVYPPLDPNHRVTELYLHRRFRQLIMDPDICAINEVVRRNFPFHKNSRSGHFPLIRPFNIIRGNRVLHVTDVYIKGILFNAEEEMVRHEGLGKVSVLRGANREGMIIEKKPVGVPSGGAVLNSVLREFLITDKIFCNAGYPNVMVPLGWAYFPGIYYDTPKGKLAMGCTIFGMYEEVSTRHSRDIKGREMVDADMSYHAGYLLGVLHSMGITHSYLHPGNYNRHAIFDLTDSKSIRIDEMTKAEFFAECICNLYYMRKTKTRYEYGEMIRGYCDARGIDFMRMRRLPLAGILLMNVDRKSPREVARELSGFLSREIAKLYRIGKCVSLWTMRRDPLAQLLKSARTDMKDMPRAARYVHNQAQMMIRTQA